jgi:hypothetical protein
MAFDGSTISTAESGTLTGGTLTDSFTLTGNDVDILAVSLQAGRVYAIDADFTGSPYDAMLRIFDQFGNEVMRNDDGPAGYDPGAAGNDGINPFVWFSANHSGTYYLAFSSFALPDYDPFTTTNRNLPGGNLGPTTT